MLGLIYRDDDGKTYNQISKTRARRLWNEGKSILAFASNVRPNNVWIRPCTFNKNAFIDETFEAACNSFMYYNCNNELGNYIHFFAPAN